MKLAKHIFFLFIVLFLPMNNLSAKGVCVEGDCINGKGSKTQVNGDKYVGGWKDGKENGQGTFTRPDGSRYVGEWKDGEKWPRKFAQAVKWKTCYLLMTNWS